MVSHDSGVRSPRLARCWSHHSCAEAPDSRERRRSSIRTETSSYVRPGSAGSRTRRYEQPEDSSARAAKRASDRCRLRCRPVLRGDRDGPDGAAAPSHPSSAVSRVVAVGTRCRGSCESLRSAVSERAAPRDAESSPATIPAIRRRPRSVRRVRPRQIPPPPGAATAEPRSHARLADATRDRRAIRTWSAGCSTKLASDGTPRIEPARILPVRVGALRRDPWTPAVSPRVGSAVVATPRFAYARLLPAIRIPATVVSSQIEGPAKLSGWAISAKSPIVPTSASRRRVATARTSPGGSDHSASVDRPFDPSGSGQLPRHAWGIKCSMVNGLSKCSFSIRELRYDSSRRRRTYTNLPAGRPS